MPSTPLICSSIGAATVSAITFGLAPGYCARTATDGGTTSGYSEIGICRSARSPATKMSTDSTPAKIGRSMKNLEIFMSRPRRRCSVRGSSHTLRSFPRKRESSATYSESSLVALGPRFRGDERWMGSCDSIRSEHVSARGDLVRRRRLCVIAAGHGYDLRIDQRARAHALQPIHHDALAGIQAVRDHAQAIDEHAERHLAVGGLVVVTDHHDVFLVLIGADRTLVDHQRRLGLGLAHA